MPFRAMTIQQAAERLHLGVREVEQLVKRDAIPFVRRGNEVVFVRRDLDAWASQRLLGMKPDSVTTHHRVSTQRRQQSLDHDHLVPMLFRAEWMAAGLLSKTKPSVMRDMVALAAKTDLLYDDAALFHGLQEREELCSTALDEGVAFLHTRYHAPGICGDSFVVLGRTVQPIFAGAADGKTTDLFFLLCCQDDALHLHTLARLCAMSHATALLADLRQAETTAEMMDALVRSENAVLQGI